MDLLDPKSYDYDLPEAQIAAEPAPNRTDSRLLVLSDDGLLRDSGFARIGDWLRDDDLLVVNDARVSPVRLHGRRATGGAVEVFVLGFGSEGDWADASAPFVAFLRSNRKVKDGEEIHVDGLRSPLVLEERIEDGRVRVRHGLDNAWSLIDDAGALPLPPYIVQRRREAGQSEVTAADHARYQTVFARKQGAVAAPTAGLHFSDELLDALQARGIELARVTLWVGAGTFRPVKAERLDAHPMHSEAYEVSADAAAALNRARAEGRRVVAVGTTVVRTLESALREDRTFSATSARTDLFIRPGYVFGAVDALLTNFHLPRSTLLTLVSAFAGHARTMEAYRHAVAAGYRFYSYGDAMFIDGRLETP